MKRAMKRLVAMLALVVALGAGGTAAAQQSQSSSQPAPPPPTSTATVTPAPAPPRGQWVYTADYGWIWVPDGTTTVVVDDVPYAYLYTPTYGWTWYVSPWGPGPFVVGPWVWHAWRPPVWHGWVALPHVIVRIGPGWHRWR
jgi:hypothetical protein